MLNPVEITSSSPFLMDTAYFLPAAVAAAVAGPPPPPPQPPPPLQPPPPPPLASSASVMSEYQEPPDTKEGIEELCPVCGDKVSGYHYGLLTCESCKGFFKRTVQNKKVYTCVAERNCHIDKSQRKRCPFCRFQKCLDVGMKLEAVRADRMRGGRNKFGPMYKRDRARKLQMLRQKQMAQQTRPPCQLTPAELAAAGITSLPSTLTYVGACGGGPGAPLYTTGGGQHHLSIKQEIQIPQLSSSTASPDSSSSPLPNNNGHHHHNNSHHPHHHPHPHQQQQQQHPANVVLGVAATTAPALASASHLSSVAGGGGGGVPAPSPTALHSPSAGAWAAPSGPHTPGTPTSSTPSPMSGSPTAAGHSPKAFHYDGAGGLIPLNGGGGVHNPAGPPTTAASAGGGPLGGGGPNGPASKVPHIIREFQQTCLDDKEWQSQLFGLLQSQTYNQCEVDLFELMCKVLEHSLFAQVDWARNSPFFKDLKVDDQMKLLQYSWSEMLILDHIHHRLHNNLPDETTLPNGQKFDLLTLAVLGLPNLVDQFNELSVKMQELKTDSVDYLCLKFLLLLNPEVRGLLNRKHIHDAHEQVKQALHDYSLNCYNQVQDKFNKMMQLLPEVHKLSLRGEEYLYYKHLHGSAPTQTLLMEMLYAKNKRCEHPVSDL